jgi:oligoendopeptidase F
MTSMTTNPRVWDLTSYFPAFEGPEYREFRAALKSDVERHTTEAAALAALSPATQAAWAIHFNALEDLSARFYHMASYLGNLGAADTSSEAFNRENAQHATTGAGLEKLSTEILRALKGVGDADWASFIDQPSLKNAEFYLGRMRETAKRRMSTPEETLASDLGVDGISAWGRLYDTVSGKMSFEMEWPDGRKEMVPMAQRRALTTNPDPKVRAAAFKKGNLVWDAASDTLGQAINAIAGTRHTLYGRRGIGSFLDQPYFDSAVSAATIDTMFRAIAKNYELPRRVLKLGAKLQGTAKLPFQDLDAPRPLDPVPPVSWEEAVAMVDKAFSAGYPALAQYFRDMLAKRWIESERRPNKRSGGYSTGSVVTGEQRIYMTYSDTMGDVMTLAHEVGHAWHSHVLKEVRPIAQEYPMTLAETASTFAEMVLLEGLLADPELSPAKRTFLLDQETMRATAFLLNIPMRYEFEKRFYEERKTGEVPVSRLKELMVQTQQEIFGDVLEEGAEDPLFWASKLHFFIPSLSFYNFPYTFGYLLSRAIFSEFRSAGPSFLPRYEAFLIATGSENCEDAVRKTLGWDIRDEAFWLKTIKTVEEPLAQFEALIAKRPAAAP